MAPSHMFSYLRPGHAKRAASRVALPDAGGFALPSPSQSTEHLAAPRDPDHASVRSSSPMAISPYPPQLPPITRVASTLERAPPARDAAAAAHPPATTTAAAPTAAAPSHGHMRPPMPLTRPMTAHLDAHPGPRLDTRSPSSTHGAPTKTRSRLNLRNPMSLLMRRRSAHTLDPLADESLVTHRSPSVMPPMPDNYDPSIRGHIVHDFNAPRLNRNFSSNTPYGPDQTPPQVGRLSPPKTDRDHTPVFREHFDDDTSYHDSQAAIRAEQLANKDFLARNSVHVTPPHLTTPPPPPPPPPPAADIQSTVLSPVQETEDAPDSTDVTPRKKKCAKTPPPARSRATSLNDPSFQSAGLPPHLTSRASRFSFQISGGSDSAQEAILEERHKKKEAEKASRQVRLSTHSVDDDDYDEYAMDDYDIHGGFEEEIPMLGDQDDFSGLGHQAMDAAINAFDFSSLSIHTNLHDSMDPSPSAALFQTPTDANGNRIGFAMSDEPLHSLSPPGAHIPPSQSDQPLDAGLDQMDTQNAVNIGLEDDMYFDDGLIGEQDEHDGAQFDENVFDDPNGPLYERNVKPPPLADVSDPVTSHQPAMSSSEMGYQPDDDDDDDDDAAAAAAADAVAAADDAVAAAASAPSLAHKPSVACQQTVPEFGDMNAYHSALADAATRAQAAGRFSRSPTVHVGQPGSDVDDVSFLTESRPSLVPDDDGRFRLETNSFVPEDDVYGTSSGFVDDYDYSDYDYDSTLEDDPMIAAANAEALAFDDEGFYGQEFGFYASAVGDAAHAWGGFFGPSGVVGRTVSGRNAVREPNLTPITERSEYSTRNSFISLHHYRDGQQPMQSPGLAQLARMSPYEWSEEDGMSMDTLLKLRKGAFGGSASSLPGSAANSPRTSSPMGMQFVPRISSAIGNRFMEHADSEVESDEPVNVEDDLEGNGEEDEHVTDAVNAARGDEEDENEDEDEDEDEHGAPGQTPESPTTLTASDYNVLSSRNTQPTHDAAPLQYSDPLPPPHSMQQAPPFALPMSPDGHGMKSPANMPLPMSPYGIPLASPYSPSRRPTAPPSIDTSLSFPSGGTLSASTGPRRPSMALASPISNSSPVTPGGNGWRAGHSRKASVADSVAYVRDHDEAGEGRWILERRRTAESGELELIGREIVEGGRI
ncbi:hypothetical protein ACEQ8H_003190 [Pleosporales sp. CAS-2024a]